MAELVFKDDYKLFDGECVRFHGFCGGDLVLCGVTTYALKHHYPDLPEHGLLPAEQFLSAYDNLMIQVHQIARKKFRDKTFEPSGNVKVMVHDTDWPK